ncbi:hypothetical protein JYU23_00045 [bacterium AH-315-C07]|nr:hypothetical protein [bacterium AH-315-C07]
MTGVLMRFRDTVQLGVAVGILVFFVAFGIFYGIFNISGRAFSPDLMGIMLIAVNVPVFNLAYKAYYQEAAKGIFGLVIALAVAFMICIYALDPNENIYVLYSHIFS